MRGGPQLVTRGGLDDDDDDAVPLATRGRGAVPNGGPQLATCGDGALPKETAQLKRYSARPIHSTPSRFGAIGVVATVGVIAAIGFAVSRRR